MLSCFFFWRLYLRGFSQHAEPVWTSFVVHFSNFSPLPSASRALNSHYQAAVAKYLLPQSQAAKKSCRLLFQMVSPRFDMHVLDSTYLIYTFWVLVSEISSWLLLILSDIIYYYGFDNISQKRNIQVTIIQNLAPKHCSTEILLIIFFKPKKWTKKKNLRHLDHIFRCIATLYSYLWCYPKLFTIHSTLLDRLDIFFWKKSPQLQGRSLLFRTLGFFFHRKHIIIFESWRN